MLPTDSVFLTAETRETPMHVGGLQLFKPPADFAGTSDLFRRLIAEPDVAPLFAKRPVRSLATAGQWAWQRDKEFDIEHHVRHNSLPKPGRVLELLALCSRLHSTLLDRKRPLWEFHLIEGLADGRFAIYFKMHHALVDGVSAQRLLQNILTRDPDVRDRPAPWAVPPRRLNAAEHRPPVGPQALRSALDLATEAAGLPGALAATLSRAWKDQSAPVSFAAPRTMFNVPITGSRRFAAQSWPLERVAGINKATDSTVNDVVLAMCSGALRRYLLELDALPEVPLISMVPVALKVKGHREAGNAVGAVMCNLATHLDDPGERLAVIRSSMRDGKRALSGMTPMQIVALTGLGMSPLILQGIPGYKELFRPPFNIIISNVPGPRSALYLNGAELDGLYPLSIPYHGQALNITCTSYHNEIAFGLTGCRRTVPHLQRLLAFLDGELTALEQAAGLT